MKARVLIVEDSKQQKERLQATLESRGYDVTAVSSGLEALRSIKASPPDVVILDVLLDDIDGYSVCRWVRLTESTRDVVVIMLTIKDGVKERIEGLHVGADDYVPKPYDPDELDARIFAALRSRTVRSELRQRNTELEGMLSRTEQMAMTDPLTTIFNRRRFTDVLKREWATAKRYSHPLTCVLVDVDHFKQINDGSGHATGDDALRRVASLLTSCIREVDVCARYGGDEFALLLPHTPADRALVVLERIRTRLAAERVAWGEPLAGLTLSLGLASTEIASIETHDELMAVADRALYQAKRNGRDRIADGRDSLGPPPSKPRAE